MDYLGHLLKQRTGHAQRSVFREEVLLLSLVLLMSSAQCQFFKDSPTSLMIGPPPMVHDPVRPNCENFTVGNWRVQEFYSPNYPGEYINNTHCVLYLVAPAGFQVKLDFRDKFFLEKSQGCKYDYLEVRDGPFAYSPTIGRYCGAKFPPLIMSTGRYMWLEFKTDDLLQYGGFRAEYSYIKDNTQNDEATPSKGWVEACRIPIKLTSEDADGVLDTNEMTLGDVTKRNAVDCTWEIFTEAGNEIQLHSTKLELPHRSRCDVNNVMVYDGTTLEDDVIARVCQANHNKMELVSDTNRVFLRIFGTKRENKPTVKVTYSVVKRAVSGHCTSREFACDGHCIPISLRCNYITNCKDRSDERGCSTFRPPPPRHGNGGGDYNGYTTGSDDSSSSVSEPFAYDICGPVKFLCDGQCVPNALRCNGHPECKDMADERDCGQEGSSLGPGGAFGGDPGYGGQDGGEDGGVEEDKAEDLDDGGIPLYIIIAGAVGGAVLTCVTIALCIMCRLRSKERRKREEEERVAVQSKAAAQRNALEMAVCNSSNTEMSLSRQNDTDPRRQGHHHQYYGGVNTTPKGDGGGPQRFSISGSSNKVGGGNHHLNSSKPTMMTMIGTGKDDTVDPADILINDNSYSADRYLSMTQSPSDDHVIYDFDTQGIYPSSTVHPMGMTSLVDPHHRMMTTHDTFGGVLHVNPWTGDTTSSPNTTTTTTGGSVDIPGGVLSSYPYSNSSLKRGSQPKTYGGLGLGKPSYYNSPESKYKKAIKTMENETIREYHVS